MHLHVGWKKDFGVDLNENIFFGYFQIRGVVCKYVTRSLEEKGSKIFLIVWCHLWKTSTTLILSNSLGLSRTSTTSTMIAATICVKSAKNRFLARPQNTIQGQDGPPFMTSSTKKESHSNKIPQQVSSSYVEFKAFLILKWSSFFHTYPQFSAFYQVYKGLRLNLKKSSQLISVGLLLTTLEVSYMFDSSWVV